MKNIFESFKNDGFDDFIFLCAEKLGVQIGSFVSSMDAPKVECPADIVFAIEKDEIIEIKDFKTTENVLHIVVVVLNEDKGCFYDLLKLSNSINYFKSCIEDFFNFNSKERLDEFGFLNIDVKGVLVSDGIDSILESLQRSGLLKDILLMKYIQNLDYEFVETENESYNDCEKSFFENLINKNIKERKLDANTLF